MSETVLSFLCVAALVCFFAGLLALVSRVPGGTRETNNDLAEAARDLRAEAEDLTYEAKCLVEIARQNLWRWFYGPG